MILVVLRLLTQSYVHGLSSSDGDGKLLRVVKPRPLMKPPQFFQLGIQLPVAHSPLHSHAPDHQATYCQVSSQN